MKVTSTYSLATLLVVTGGGLGYNAWIDRHDQQAYAEGMALLEAQESEPTTRRTVVEDGVTWHEKCEKGFCLRANNAWMGHRDQQAYAAGMALLAAQETVPTIRRTIIEEGVTWHEKCEKGFCMRSTDPEILEQPLAHKGGGMPVYDMAAIYEMEKRAQQSY